jgi:hypothetical protein
VHLYLLDAVSLARLTATALDIKGKSSRLIALCLGISGTCKEIANIAETSRVGCGVRAWSSSYGALVYRYDLIKIFNTFYALIFATRADSVIKLSCQHGVDYAVYK